jgi:hypothetical protein
MTSLSSVVCNLRTIRRHMKEIINILRRPKIHYHINKSLLLISIPSLLNPVHIPHLTYLRFSYTLRSHRSSDLRRVLQLEVFPSNPSSTSPICPACYMLRAVQLTSFDHPTDVWRVTKIKSIMLRSFLQSCASPHTVPPFF